MRPPSAQDRNSFGHDLLDAHDKMKVLHRHFACERPPDPVALGAAGCNSPHVYDRISISSLAASVG